MRIAYINGKIHTMKQDQVVEAMIVEDDKIVMVGSSDSILKHRHDQVVDLNNNLVLPGFNDSHLHLLLTSQNLQQIDVSNTTSIDNLIEKAKSQLPSKLDKEKWLIGRGWNQDYFDVKTFPTKDDLDKITTDAPLVLIRACIHICVVNSRALEIINLNKDNLPVLDDGMIYLDEQGELNGLFSESALNYVYDNFSEPNLEDIKQLILDIQPKLNSEGITSVQTDDFTALNNVDYKQIIKAYTQLAQDNQLSIKVYQQCLLSNTSLLQEFIDLNYNKLISEHYYRLGPLKLLLDGSLGARTALLEDHYFDDTHAKGISVYNDDELFELSKLAQENNMQMAIHGIGDGAINQIIRTYQKTNEYLFKENARHGIVHAQITDKEALDLIKQEDIVVYAQPIFLHYDIHMVDQRVGIEKGKTSYAFKTLMDSGVSVSMGTDAPVEPTNPFANIYCAITRNDLKASLAKGWNEHECLSVQQAVYAYTYEAAYQSFEEDIKGSLEKGKQADFIVLDQDIFNIKPIEILKTKVLQTYLDGKLVYEQ